MPDTAALARDLEWNDLHLILAIGREGGLSGAARKLGQTHSTVFRRLNAVEERTGVRFFDRFRMGYEPTEAGRTAVAFGERVEAEFHALGLEVLGRDDQLRGPIRVTCPEYFAEEIAPEIVAGFCAEHPEITIELAPGHGALDLNRREAEVAIRATRQPPEGAFGRRICDFRLAIFASPDVIARLDDRPLPEQRFCAIDGTQVWFVPWFWPTQEDFEHLCAFRCRASRAVVNAARAGIGIAPLPCYVGDGAEGLVRVSDTLPRLDMELWVLTHPDLRRTARIRAFMTYLYDALAARADLFAGQAARPGGRVLWSENAG